MRAIFGDDADFASGVPEGHQTLVEQFQSNGRAIGSWQLAGNQRRQPEPTKQLPDRRAGARAAARAATLAYLTEGELPSGSDAMSSDTASIRARWVNACGKFPRCWPVVVSISSA